MHPSGHLEPLLGETDVRHELCVDPVLQPASFVHATHSKTCDVATPFSCKNAFIFVKVVACSAVLRDAPALVTTNTMYGSPVSASYAIAGIDTVSDEPPSATSALYICCSSSCDSDDPAGSGMTIVAFWASASGTGADGTPLVGAAVDGRAVLG